MLDASNLIHAGSNSEIRRLCGKDKSVVLKGIPYLFGKVASYAVKNQNLVIVFDPDRSGKFHGNSEFPTNRIYNPQVVWELRVLRGLLKFIGCPMIEEPGYSADSLIYSLCETYKSNPEDHYIISADQDLACNVRNRGQYTTQILSYNIHSYNIDPSSFSDILRIPFNFINIYKLLTGCKSDNIPVFKFGQALWNEYLELLKFLTCVSTPDGSDSLSLFSKYNDPFEHNTREAFFDWVKDVKTIPFDMDQLKVRADHVFPKFCNVSLNGRISWERWNAVSKYLFNMNNLQFIQKGSISLTESDKGYLDNVIDKTPLVNSTVFTPASGSEETISYSDISELTIFDEGGVDL